MLESEIEISVVAADGILLVTMHVPRDAPKDEVVACMFRIAAAFATVEQLEEEELQDLCWEQNRAARKANCFVVKREYLDPGYPQKFDLALRSAARRDSHDYVH